MFWLSRTRACNFLPARTEIVCIDIKRLPMAKRLMQPIRFPVVLYQASMFILAASKNAVMQMSSSAMLVRASCKPGGKMDRLVLAAENAKTIAGVMTEVTRYTRDAVFIMITNPLDVTTILQLPNSTILPASFSAQEQRLRRCASNISLRSIIMLPQQMSKGICWANTATPPSRPGAR